MQPYKVIAGTFHVKGYSPDGDSIRFQAKDAAHWKFFNWSKASKADDKKHQLRIEAIDSLETHYENFRQPRAFALAALERLLELLGITDVEYNLVVTEIVKAKDAAPGYIVSAGVDVFDRPISFLFDASVKLTDGAVLTAEQIPFEKSINYRLAEDAIVYPTFYTTLEPAVIETFRQVFKRVKNTRQGLWAIDRTAGFRMLNPATIMDDVIIMPKLFRRFISFFKARGNMNEFKEYVRTNNEKVLWNGQQQLFSDLISVSGNLFRFKASPEDLVFAPG